MAGIKPKRTDKTDETNPLPPAGHRWRQSGQSADTVSVGRIASWILGWWLGRLNRIDYDVTSQLIGIAGETAKQYPPRGENDPRNLENVLQWVNGRRAAKGLSLIGAPTMNAPDAEG